MQTHDDAQSFVDALVAKGVTGASFACWDGAKLHTAVAGLRNSVTGDPVTLDTLMHIGSITKVFNAVLLLQLVDEGKIALQDAVIKHLPELRLRDRQALSRITCEMLINHTNGIDGDAFPDYGPDRERIEDAIVRCEELGQLHAPGEAASYSNIGTVIAGYLVQKLRQTSWYSLIKTRIFEPLGMLHAISELTDLPRFRHSVGDVTDRATGRSVQTTRPFLSLSFAPAGATLMMTAADLVSFARALLNGGVGANGTRILSEALSARMARPTAEFVSPVGAVGLGWMVRAGGLLSHSGGGPGVFSQLYAHPASGRALALLTNCDRMHLLTASLEPLFGSWTGSRAVESAAPDSVSDVSDPAPYEGVYESGLVRAEVIRTGHGLALRMSMKTRIYDNSIMQTEAPAIPLRPLGNDTFDAGPALQGFPSTRFRLVRPDAAGRMRFFAMGSRLLARTQ
jgi:CubicO group peptidase (beta-lactamase class C family)